MNDYTHLRLHRSRTERAARRRHHPVTGRPGVLRRALTDLRRDTRRRRAPRRTTAGPIGTR